MKKSKVKSAKRLSKKAGLPPGTLVYVGEQRAERVRISCIDYDVDSITETIEAEVEQCIALKDTSTATWINVDGLHDVKVIEKFGQGFGRIMPTVRQIYQERLKRPPTAAVNDAVQQAVASHNLPRRGRKQLRVLYATQAEVNPPTFVFFVNDTALIHFSYQRYLENSLRRAFGFDGTPIRLVFKTRSSS